MPSDRSLGRNVHFYDATSPEVPLGGMIQNGSVTENVFLVILGILLISQAPLRVQERTSGHTVTTTNNPLQPGEYNIYCDGRCSLNESFNCLLTLKTDCIEISDEPWIHRLITHNVSGRDSAFRNGIRARDGKCVISGLVNRAAFRDEWMSFEAAHIFPLESESYWVAHNYGRWITDMESTNGVSRIRSLPNGFLLRADVHQPFDQYVIAVNPDVSFPPVHSSVNLH